MENIIKKAIKGGYKYNAVEPDFFSIHPGHIKAWYWANEDNGNDEEVDPKLFFLDPFFWQALGKSCGWEDTTEGCSNDSCSFCEDYSRTLSGWIYYASKFYRINLTEGWDKAVAYLEELTSK